MPEDTPNHKKEIAILTELILDLYAKYAALAIATAEGAPGYLRDAEVKQYEKLSHLPAIAALIQKLDSTTLEAARGALKEFRG